MQIHVERCLYSSIEAAIKSAIRVQSLNLGDVGEGREQPSEDC